MMKYMERVLFGGLVLLMLPISGFACSTAQWDLVSSATAASPPTFGRFSEKCAMQVTDTGYVQDNSPSNHTTFIARFYVRPNLAGAGQADLFVAYNNETPNTPVLKVSFDGTSLDFHAAGGPVGGASVVIDKTKWHLVEIKYVSGGNTEYWVNTNAATVAANGSYPSATGAVEAVRLGLPNGKGGFTTAAVTFDAYESHSSTPVGSLFNCDSNGDTNLGIADLVTVGIELNIGTLASGQPDCNSDGAIGIADLVSIGILLNQ